MRRRNFVAVFFAIPETERDDHRHNCNDAKRPRDELRPNERAFVDRPMADGKWQLPQKRVKDKGQRSWQIKTARKAAARDSQDDSHDYRETVNPDNKKHSA